MIFSSVVILTPFLLPLQFTSGVRLSLDYLNCRYGIASLAPARANPSQLLTFTRHHWGIENGLHWVRDVTFGEDRSVLRSGHTHHVMATLRNLALSLLRIHGYTHIASTLRLFAAQPILALQLVTNPLLIGE
jgi:hypothetical protein